MATLDDVYYEYFFGTAKPMISGYDLRNEWVNDDGLAQEYVIHFQLADGSVESHPVVSRQCSAMVAA